jgi:hypothetical protein
MRGISLLSRLHKPFHQMKKVHFSDPEESKWTFGSPRGLDGATHWSKWLSIWSKWSKKIDYDLDLLQRWPILFVLASGGSARAGRHHKIGAAIANEENNPFRYSLVRDDQILFLSYLRWPLAGELNLRWLSGGSPKALRGAWTAPQIEANDFPSWRISKWSKKIRFRSLFGDSIFLPEE